LISAFEDCNHSQGKTYLEKKTLSNERDKTVIIISLSA